MNTAPLRIAIVLSIAGTALLTAGCGGATKGQPPSSASGAPSGAPPQSTVDAAYKYSRCMRQHGVASFPDPHVVNSPGEHGMSIHVDPGITGSPDFNTAQKACAGIMGGPSNSNVGPSPQQEAARLKGILGFATCMRNHQVPSFPDPNAQGRLNAEMISAAGINLHAPAVDHAATACVSASGGQITAADVAQAESGNDSSSGSSSSASGG
jgi:hypothetical protein